MPPLKAPQEHGAIIAEPPLTEAGRIVAANRQRLEQAPFPVLGRPSTDLLRQDRKSTRLSSSHVEISYAVFCLKKKKKSEEPNSHQHEYQPTRKQKSINNK